MVADTPGADLRARYPFVDLRPSLKFTHGYWAALTEQERKDALATAAWAHVRIEFVEDDIPPPAENT
jgi:hypothetical protein